MRAKKASRGRRPVTYTTTTGVYVDDSGLSARPGGARRAFSRRAGRTVPPYWKKRIRSALATAAAIGAFALLAHLFGDAWLMGSIFRATPAPAVITAAPESKALSANTPAAAPSEAEIRVWLPASGQRYHATSTCSGMKDAAEVPLSQAKAEGYTPCKRCHPPE